MPATFSIQTAAARSGLTPHVIRAWERRYAAIEPERSAGRHRLYTEEEVERLAMLSRAVRSGHSIGKVAKLSTAELRGLIARDQAPGSRAAEPGDVAVEYREGVLAAVRGFDAPLLDAGLQRALVALGHQGLLQRVIAPLAAQIGQLWRTGELMAAHEHFFSASVKHFLGDLARQYASSADAPRIVISTLPGQLHELGATMTAAVAANLGWRAIYLGPSLPAHEIAGAALQQDAAALALSLVYPEDDPAVPGELEELARLLPPRTRLLVGGRAARAYVEMLVRVEAICVEDIGELAAQLERIRRTHRART